LPKTKPKTKLAEKGKKDQLKMDEKFISNLNLKKRFHFRELKRQ